MNKIIGLLTAWGAERWIKPAIEQALSYCDETIVVVSAFVPELEQFEDRTLDICKEHEDIKLLDYRTDKDVISEAVADTLNYMLKSSPLYEPGNWAWILDADEFYADTAHEMIRAAIDVKFTNICSPYDQITVESRFFYINMQHYLNEDGDRLFRINEEGECFVPTNKWSTTRGQVYILPRNDGMFHYGLLASADIYRAKWQVEYKRKKQADKVRWIDEIYPNYDLRDEERWIEENCKRFSIRSPWFNRGFTPDENGRLFRYAGKHPKFIENSGLTKIEDFR